MPDFTTQKATVTNKNHEKIKYHTAFVDEVCNLTVIIHLDSTAVSTSLRSILLVEFLGLDQLGKSFGMLSLFQGVAALIGAPIAGRFG